MKIGIYINQSSSSGGGFYEAVGSAKYFESNKLEIQYFSSNKDSKQFLENQGIKVTLIKINYFDRFVLFLRRLFIQFAANLTPGNITPVRILKKFIPKFNRYEKHFVENKIDLIYFTSPDTNCIYIENLNYVITVWDLAHSTIPYFPEIRRNSVFETREIYYKNVLSKAYCILVGHELAKSQLINNYRQNKNKIFTIPFKPSLKLVELHNKENNISYEFSTKNFPSKYLYYPAQYAAHKNHRILIDAIDILRERNCKDFGIVFSGRDRGNLAYLKKIVKEKKLEDYIIFLPFVSDEELYDIFKNAFALAMPTYIGPGTLPTMEAMYIDVPVILPDLDFNKSFYDDSCLYYETGNSVNLVEKIIYLEQSPSFKSELLNNSQNKYKEIMLSSESTKFIKYVENFKPILHTYRDPLLGNRRQ